MANPTEAEMMADLAKADAAGDTQLATRIAGNIKAARSAPSFGDRALNMIGRGAWALPSLVGLSHERVQAALTGTPIEKQHELSARVDRDNPITSGLVRGVAAAPGEALAWMAAPEAKVAQGAGALTKFLTYGPRAGTLAGASEYGANEYKPEGQRVAGSLGAALLGGFLGGGMAAGLPNPAAMFPRRPVFDPMATELAAARAQGNSLSASRAASDALAQAEGGGAAAQGGGAAGQSSSTVVVRPRRILPQITQPPEPIPEARLLQSRGVQLTGGLQDPNSAYGHIEIASQSKGIVGPGIRNQRQRALGQSMDLVFEEAKPPGVPDRIGSGGNVNDKYARLKGIWDREFNAIRGKDERIQPAVIEGEMGRPLKGTPEAPGVIDDIVNDYASPGAAVWNPESRKTGARFLDAQMGRLFGQRAKDEAGRVPIGDVMKVLSDVRSARRNAVQAQDWTLFDMYSRAEDAIENAITSQASPATAKRLGELFGGYRNFKIVESAVLKAKDSPAGMTPASLQNAVSDIVGRTSEYAAGGGGPIRDLSKAVRTVFDESGAPPTGARILADIPWLSDKLAAPTIYLRNRSAAAAQGGAAAAQGGKAAARASAAARSAAQAQLEAQAAAQGVGPSLLSEFMASRPIQVRSQTPAAQALAAAMQRRLGVLPAFGEEDR